MACADLLLVLATVLTVAEALRLQSVARSSRGATKACKCAGGDDPGAANSCMKHSEIARRFLIRDRIVPQPRRAFTSMPGFLPRRMYSAIVGMALIATPAAAGDTLEPDHWSIKALQVGAFVFVSPKYEGSDEYEVSGFPILAPAGFGIGDDGYVQFRGPDDLRLRLLNVGGFEAGPLIGWRFDRDQDDSSRLYGLGDVDGGVVVGAYVGYRTGPLMPFVSYHHQVSGDDTGGVIRFGAEAKTMLPRGIAVAAIVGASYADDDYMDAYFSVTPLQSANSLAGLRVYDAEAGIKDVYVGVTADVPIGAEWTLKLSGRYTHLLGDVADSPVVESESQLFGGVGLTYRFDLAR